MILNMIYHNVVFRTEIKTEFELAKAQCLLAHTWNRGITMEGIASWCKAQGIKYSSRFYWKSNYSVLANLWNLYSYIRFKIKTGTTLKG